jgi:LuxR family maltose regulon positive regulatory protein
VTDSGGLLATKFARPQLPPTLVVRRRLMDRLDEGAQGQVTLVTAGPGWGKTVLVAAWADTGRLPGPVAWLSLDRYDNNPAAFWSYVLGALRSTGAIPEDNPLASMSAGPRIDDAFVRRIAGAIAGLPRPIVLILDDLHEIDNPRVLESLALLLRYPVPQLRVVITTREDRVVPAHRLRIRQQLVEIRAAELNFTIDEATELLGRHHPELTAAEVGMLLDRTEGWSAGLRLAAMLLNERGTQEGLEEFTGTERTVAEYLASEVLARQPPEARRFLLVTSVTDRVCGDLANTLTGDADGDRILHRLAGENALVMRLGSRLPWFRYHGLLLEFLRQQLQLEMPELVRDLHLRAAHWFADKGVALYSVNHAVAAQDWPLVGRLMTVVAAARIVSPDHRPLMDLLARVPVDQLSATAGLELCAALLAYDRQDYDAIPASVARARALVIREDADLRRPTEVVARALEVTVARVRGDMAAVVATTDALDLLAQVSRAQFPSADEYRAIALNNAGVGLFWMGHFGPAETRLRSGMAMAEASGVELTQLNAIGHLALLKAEQGGLRDAYRHARSGLDLAAKRGWRSVLQVVPTFVALALTNLEWNDLGAAEAAFTEGLAAQRADPEPVQYFALRIAEARILLARRQVDAARLVALQIAQEISAFRTPPVLDRWLAVAEAQIELAAGNPEEVIRRIGRSANPETTDVRMWNCVAHAHYLLGELEMTEMVLSSLHTSAPDVVSAVETWILTALVQDSLRQNNRSVDAFARAVALAEPEGIHRPFAGNDRSRIQAFLERHQWLAQRKSAFVAELLADLTSEPSLSAPVMVMESLTDRELDVLRYLPTMLTNQEMATQMYVSVNTVKAHLRSLYRKFGVTRRHAAVDRARELGLL